MWMLTDLKSTLRFLRMSMHLSLGHVTLLREKLQLPKFPPIKLTTPGVFRLGYPEISSFLFYLRTH